MEYLSEAHLKLLLQKEWLVKVDNEHSTPYLLKFYSSTVDLSCCILITDTRNVWGEVLTSKQFARRWRDCNAGIPSATSTTEDEDEWRTRIIDVLSTAHSLGGIVDLSFEVVNSHNADLAVELGSDQIRWRWETYSLGPRVSADVLSKHLILPLISVTHLAFSSADPVSELTDADLEKAVDKVGRTARRTLDTHVKHAISRPRVATSLQRMTAMFNFLPDLPPILADFERPELVLPMPPQPRSRSVSKPPRVRSPAREIPHDSTSTNVARDVPYDSPMQKSYGKALAGPPVDSGSETEQSEDGEPAPSAKATKEVRSARSSNVHSETSSRAGSPKRVGLATSGPNTPSATAAASRRSSQAAPVADQTSSPPAPPAKRAKHAAATSDSDDNGEGGSAQPASQPKSGPARRGAKQPIKRGGRRF